MRSFRRLVPIVAVACCLHIVAQTPAPVPANEQPGFNAISEAALRSNLAYIASDKLLGRMSLQPGDDEAASWVAQQFAAAHLKPAAMDAHGKPGYFQPITLVEYRPDRGETSITLTRTGKPTVWHAPEAFGLYKHAVDLTASVVFAGFGITAPALDYDDYKGLDVKGKIVLVFDHEPQEGNPRSRFNGVGNTRYATSHVKLVNAQMHGAVALVIVAEPNRDHPTNAERQARIGGSLTRSVPIPIQALADDEITIPIVTVNDAVAAQMLATTGTTGSALQNAIDIDLKPQSRALPDTSLALHVSNTSERSAVTNNVAGLLEGSDPKLAAETIIISAHHDHDGSAPGVPAKAPDGTSTPADAWMDIWHGADDNGSGTVGVVELAKAFAANPARPRRSILFVVFASEERGLLGSYWMAAHPLRPLATTRAVINFDMIGRDETPSPQTDGLIDIPADTTNRLNLIGALYSPEYDRVVAEENQHVGLTLDHRFDRDHILNVFFRSDQFPFVLHDIPAFWWFTGFHPDYHHTTDTADKIDYPKMKKILELAYLSAWHFADSAKTPAFVADPEPGGGRVKGAR